MVNNCTRNSVSDIYSERLRPREQKKIMTEMLMPLRDKILCCVSGNHERRSSKDVDDDICYDIMCKLDLEHLYRENIAFVKVQIGSINGNDGQNVLGGSLMDGVDALVVGHSHRPMVTQPTKIKIDPFNNRVSFKPFKVVTATSWLEYGGYAAQKMLPPTSHALQALTLCGKRKELKVTM